MVLGNPALIVCLLSQSTGCNGRSISTNDGDLILGSNGLLGTLGRTLGALTTQSALLGLWEKSLDPGFVYEVENASGACEEEEV